MERGLAWSVRGAPIGTAIAHIRRADYQRPVAEFCHLFTMANVAKFETGLISERTKAALKAAKARGVRLGRHGAEVLAPKYHAEAIQRAKQLAPIIRELRGYSLSRIAAELNKRKVTTPRGGRWDHSSVRNVLQRL